MPASWIDEGDILDSSSAERSWQRKLEGAERSGLVVAFCGRLHDDKGLPQLLAAVELLAARGVQVTLDILGDGDLRGLCASVSQRLPGPGAVRLVGTIPYGGAFFERLRDYHAIVVPSLSDEQPRIVFDAYSQAVPVLAADTPGLRAVIRAGQTGLFARASTPADWADLLAWAVHHQSTLYHMGCTALGEAHDMTHTAMHERRRRLLAALVGATQVGAGAAA